MPKLNGNFNIALDVMGKKMDSFEFSNLIYTTSNINFFIGGAFGFSEDFKSNCNNIVSISDMTMAHKIASIVLLEQIFRALCIKKNHPYHK